MSTRAKHSVANSVGDDDIVIISSLPATRKPRGRPRKIKLPVLEDDDNVIVNSSVPASRPVRPLERANAVSDVSVSKSGIPEMPSLIGAVKAFCADAKAAVAEPDSGLSLENDQVAKAYFLEELVLSKTYHSFRVLDCGSTIDSSSFGEIDRNTCGWNCVSAALWLKIGSGLHPATTSLLVQGKVCPRSLKSFSSRKTGEKCSLEDLAHLALMLDISIAIWEVSVLPEQKDILEKTVFGVSTDPRIDLFLYQGHYTIPLDVGFMCASRITFPRGRVFDLAKSAREECY
jgi:hypothetical protein